MFSYIKVRRIHKIIDQELQGDHQAALADDFLKDLQVRYTVADAELKNIPASGPFLVVANHPYGFLDSLVLLNIFGRHHGNFKIISALRHPLLESVQPFLIDPKPSASNSTISPKAVAHCMQHLGEGGTVGLFPEKDGKGGYWDDCLVDLVLDAGVPVVPVYFYGNHSRALQLLERLPVSLRTLALPAELKFKQRAGIRLRIGKPISADELRAFGDHEKARRYLKICLSALGSKVEVKRLLKDRFKLSQRVARIIDPVPVSDLEAELEGVRAHGGLLHSKGSFEIYLGRSEWIPSVLRELGRLREVTFREVGEGTNKKMDVDEYDLYYNHLFVWDKDNRRIIGAYRLGRGDEIVGEYGTKGFYVTSLFALGNSLIPMLNQTLELGRSFVVKEYQQKPLPLFLLWQGILCFLRNHPQYRFLMGPVSISNDFSVFSKDLIISFIRKNYFNTELARHVTPHQAFVVQTPEEELELILEKSNNDLVQLDKFIASIEPGYLKIPVLLKQYIRQNAKIIAFNVDPLFNHCLDGLMILDLNDVPDDTLGMLQRR